jgi:hypothetical protein
MARVGDSLLVRWCANTAADDTQGSAVAGEANPSFIQRGFEVRKKDVAACAKHHFHQAHPLRWWWVDSSPVSGNRAHARAQAGSARDRRRKGQRRPLGAARAAAPTAAGEVLRGAAITRCQCKEAAPWVQALCVG